VPAEENIYRIGRRKIFFLVNEELKELEGKEIKKLRRKESK
jgi:hypothetical protein